MAGPERRPFPQGWRLPAPPPPPLPFPRFTEEERHLLFLAAVNDPIAHIIDNILLAPFPFVSDAVANTWSDNIRADDSGGTEYGSTNIDKSQCNKVSPGRPLIGIGSGTTPPAPTNYWYVTSMTDGVADTVTDISSGNTVAYKFSKLFTNPGPGTWSVNEIGVCACTFYNGGGLSPTYMIIRDVLPSTRTVGPGQTLTVSYTFQTVV